MTDRGDAELRVAVGRSPVTVVLLDGTRIEVEVFLHEGSDRHPGAETLLERLNNPDERFLPCYREDHEELVHLERVAYVELPGPAPEVEDMDELGADHEAVELLLTSGESLEGELIYLAPSHRRRISDLLNHPDEPFLLLVGPDRSRYLHRAAIVRVRL